MGSVDSDNPSPVASDNEDEKTLQPSQSSLERSSSSSKLQTLSDKDKKNVKIAKTSQRPFLFQDEVFMQIFAKIIGNGIEDRGKESREKAMKVLKKIEATNEEI